MVGEITKLLTTLASVIEVISEKVLKGWNRSSSMKLIKLWYNIRFIWEGQNIKFGSKLLSTKCTTNWT